jgi:DNA-binding CsgD family transcriptional regulator
LDLPEDLRRSIGSPLHTPREAEELERVSTAVESALGTERFTATHTGGGALSLEEAVAEGIAAAASFASEHASGPPAAATAAPPAAPSLTPRERDVLALLAEGRSDQAIAEALSISRKTASNHVAAILRKLGVETRRAASRLAVQDGLV